MGKILWEEVGIEGEPPQGLGRPLGGRHCPAWGDEIRLENREGGQGVEVGKSVHHTAQGGGDCCQGWEQEKQLRFFIFFEFTSNLKIFIKFVAIVHLDFREW